LAALPLPLALCPPSPTHSHLPRPCAQPTPPTQPIHPTHPPDLSTHPTNQPIHPPIRPGGGTIAFDDPCDYFTVGKVKACTLSLSVLVAIEVRRAGLLGWVGGWSGQFRLGRLVGRKRRATPPPNVCTLPHM